MKKNYKLLMQAKEINKFFKKSSKLDIYDSQAMKSQLQVTWKEISYEDLEIMEVTIQNDINNQNSTLNLFGLSFGFIVTLAIGFFAAFVAFVASSNDESYKSQVFTLITRVILTYIILVAIHFIYSWFMHKKYNKTLTIIRILKDLKKV
ncbi:hypothetical protein ACZ11_07620 [Lysinibacillus xylanilyticus]|uniref:Uncharacterized protein n=1 Tax=Lysinibacillus xylanilyticus TaxID=582475 RepID=A0A0K9FC61_9BACI|nr:hypothetical protein [Lysinibacillus xylanilyticus]KMY32030.1 hypothetical protein ACZ11_07620 [Lysinibacillus xylanilyticus]